MTRVSASLYVRTPSGLQKSPVYYWVDAVSRNGMKYVESLAFLSCSEQPC